MTVMSDVRMPSTGCLVSLIGLAGGKEWELGFRSRFLVVHLTALAKSVWKTGDIAVSVLSYTSIGFRRLQLFFFKVYDANKDVRVTFSGGQTVTLVLSPDLYDPTVEKIHPSIMASSIRVEVLTVHTQTYNGFSEIMVWEVVQ